MTHIDTIVIVNHLNYLINQVTCYLKDIQLGTSYQPYTHRLSPLDSHTTTFNIAPSHTNHFLHHTRYNYYNFTRRMLHQLKNAKTLDQTSLVDTTCSTAGTCNRCTLRAYDAVLIRRSGCVVLREQLQQRAGAGLEQRFFLFFCGFRALVVLWFGQSQAD